MTRDEKVEVAAAAAHMANRAYCIGIGDTSQPTWLGAPAWQRTSAIKGVEGALRGNTPRESHESWLEEKRATGWKYGPTKNPEAKEHPWFVPYEELPPAQRLKDEIFLATVVNVAASLGITGKAE